MSDIEARIKMALEKFWDDRAIPGEASETGSVDELVGPVESMTAVEVLVELDQIVGFKVPLSVIKAGGYSARDEFVEKLGACVMTKVKDKGRSEE